MLGSIGIPLATLQTSFEALDLRVLMNPHHLVPPHHTEGQTAAPEILVAQCLMLHLALRFRAVQNLQLVEIDCWHAKLQSTGVTASVI
jgi:hypothetical protein